MTMRLGLILKSNDIVSDGLVLHLDAGNLISYKGTGTTWSDISGLGNHGTWNVSPTYNIDKRGDLSFNGSSTQVAIPDHASIEFGTGNFSMETWINPASISTWQVVIGKYRTGSNPYDVSYGIRLNNTSLFANISDGVTSFSSSNYTVTTNKWYHVVYVYRTGTTKTMSTYINGKLIYTDTHTLSSILNTSNSLYLGNYNNNEASRYFSGRMGSLRLYNRALTSSEVLTNYNVTKSRFGQ
jgi:hypothetical protein